VACRPPSPRPRIRREAWNGSLTGPNAEHPEHPEQPDQPDQPGPRSVLDGEDHPQRGRSQPLPAFGAHPARYRPPGRDPTRDPPLRRSRPFPSRDAQTLIDLREVDYVGRMNRRVASSRMPSVAGASVTRGQADEADLAGNVHQIPRLTAGATANCRWNGE